MTRAEWIVLALITPPCVAIPAMFIYHNVSVYGIEPLVCEVPAYPPEVCEPATTRVVFEGDTCYLDCRVTLPVDGKIRDWCDDRVFRRSLGEETFAPLDGWCTM